MSLHPKLIKIIYCYLVCFFLVIYLLFSTASLISKGLDIFYFEDRYTPSFGLTKSEYIKRENLKNISPEQTESMRQIEIAEDKAIQLKQSKTRLIDSGTAVILSFFLLMIHVLIIRRSHHS